MGISGNSLISGYKPVSFHSGSESKLTFPFNPGRYLTENTVTSNGIATTNVGPRGLVFALDGDISPIAFELLVTVASPGARFVAAVYELDTLTNLPGNRVLNLGNSNDTSVAGMKQFSIPVYERRTLQAGIPLVLAIASRVAGTNVRNTGAMRSTYKNGSTGVAIMQFNPNVVVTDWPTTWAALGGVTTTAATAAIVPYLGFVTE
jgi:hypothetical protein